MSHTTSLNCCCLCMMRIPTSFRLFMERSTSAVQIVCGSSYFSQSITCHTLKNLSHNLAASSQYIHIYIDFLYLLHFFSIICCCYLTAVCHWCRLHFSCAHHSERSARQHSAPKASGSDNSAQVGLPAVCRAVSSRNST